MSLFACGLASILQIKTWGPVGSGLLSIQGTSFNFVTPLIMGGLALNDHTFGAPKNLMLAGAVLLVIILLNRQRNPYLRVASLVIAMVVGYLLAWATGMLPPSASAQPLIVVPTPLYYGLGFD